LISFSWSANGAQRDGLRRFAFELETSFIEKPDIADVYAEQFEHILVDEYQDTNKLQAELIDLSPSNTAT
jgi:superfamily I DNA/RNA helicase